MHSNFHFLNPLTCQSLQSEKIKRYAIYVTKPSNHTDTLQCLSADTRMFLAARSRWTKDFLDKYSIPNAIWQQKLRSMWSRHDERSSSSLQWVQTLKPQRRAVNIIHVTLYEKQNIIAHMQTWVIVGGAWGLLFSSILAQSWPNWSRYNRTT